MNGNEEALWGKKGGVKERRDAIIGGGWHERAMER